MVISALYVPRGYVNDQRGAVVEEEAKLRAANGDKNDDKCPKCTSVHGVGKCPARVGCFACGELNHYATQCRARPAKRMRWRKEIKRMKADGQYLHPGYLYELKLHRVEDEAAAAQAMNDHAGDGDDSRGRRGRQRRGAS